MFEDWRQARQETEDLNLIPVMNLFMVLIPFLLMGAAFFHVAVIPTSTPSHTPGESDVPKTPTTVSASLVLEPDSMSVSFTSTNLSEAQINDMSREWAVEDGKMPAEKLHNYLKTIKKKYPESTTLVVLPHNKLSYQQLVQVLDRTREFEAGTNKDGDKVYKELFPVTVFSKLVKAGDNEQGAAAEGGEPQ